MMNSPAQFVLMQVVLREQPSLEAAAQQLGVAPDDIDEDYGLVAVDPEQGVYALKVRADRIKEQGPDDPYRGPFSNPGIGPLGSKS